MTRQKCETSERPRKLRTVVKHITFVEKYEMENIWHKYTSKISDVLKFLGNIPDIEIIEYQVRYNSN